MKPWTAQHRFGRVVAVVLFFVASSLAQSTGGRILGRVTDSSGAVVPKVKITLTNEQTGIARTTETDASGDYSFVEVPVASYRVDFEAKGFQKTARTGVGLNVNQVINLNVTLEVGAGEQTVEVTAEAPLVETTSTQLGAVLNERAVNNLPLNERDTYQLLQLQPGVQSTVGSDLFFGSDASGSVSVNGGRGRSNNFSVNGGDSNDLFVNSAAVQPSPDSVQEFRVIANTFDAEYGRNSGSVINVITKSGTNNWHGSLYEFFRNDVLNSRGFFDVTKPEFRQNQFGGTFGGPIKKDRTFFFTSYEGRRIVRGTSGPVGSVLVPTVGERTGNFSDAPFDPNPADGLQIGTQFAANVLNARPGCANAITTAGGLAPAPGVLWAQVFPNNAIPTQCMDPVALDLLNLYVPPPNSPDGAHFFQLVNGTIFADQFTVRLDHRLTDRQNLSVYYYFDDLRQFDPFARFQSGGANVPNFGDSRATRVQQWNVSHTFTINTTTVNELRLTYFRESDGTFLHPQHTNNVVDSCSPAAAAVCFNGLAPLPATDGLGNPLVPSPLLGITPNLGPNREGVPFVSISGAVGFGNNFEGELPQTGNTYQISDNITKIKGKHTLKFGADFRNQRFSQTLFFDVNGEFLYFGGGPNDTGNLFANYLLGFPDSYTQGSAQNEDVRTNSYYLFAQDSWRIKENLTLNYGLRWELNTPLADAGHRVQTYRPGQFDTVFPCVLSPQGVALLGATSTDCSPTGPENSVFPTGLVVPGDKGIPAGLTQTYYAAFAPRIGLAWSPGWDKNWITGGPGKMSVRMGYGIFYNPIEQLVLEQFSAEPPFGGSNGISEGLFATPFVDQFGLVHPNAFNGVLNPVPGQPVDWSLFRPIILFGQFQPNMRAQYSDQYNLSIQRQLTNSMMIQVAYVGSQGHRLLATHDINFSNPQTCLGLNVLLGPGTCGPFAEDAPFFVPPTTVIPQGFTFVLPYTNGGGPSTITGGPGGTVLGTVAPNGLTFVGLRPFSSPQCNPYTGAGCPPDGTPVFASIFAQDTIANSNYNSLQVLFERQFSKGLQFQAAYTWSKSIDNASSFENILNPICIPCNRALSLFDARNRFVFSYYWEPPIPKYSGAEGKVLNGWAFSGIVTLQSGFPIRITSSDDLELMNSFDFELPGEPNLVNSFQTGDPRNNQFCAIGTGPVTLGSVPCQTGTYWFNPNSFQPQALGTIGNSPRTICCGPGIANIDFAIHKDTPIGENKQIEFRAEIFNLFNHTQFLTPDGNITDGQNFGLVTRARDPRLIQFALKFSF